LVISRHIGRKDVCEEKVIKKIFNELNVNATFSYFENYEAFKKQWSEGKHDAFVEIYIFANKEAFSILKKFLKSRDNLSLTPSNDLDVIWNNIWSVNNSSERYKIYQQMNLKIQNNGHAYPLYYSGHRNVISKCIANTSKDYILNPFYGILFMEKEKGCL
jgi:hypothetical protein